MYLVTISAPLLGYANHTSKWSEECVGGGRRGGRRTHSAGIFLLSTTHELYCTMIQLFVGWGEVGWEVVHVRDDGRVHQARSLRYTIVSEIYRYRYPKVVP